MVSKCANPSCSTQFLYLHEGRLFRLDSRGPSTTHSTFDDEAGSTHADVRIEWFWLCPRCSDTLTLRYSKQSGLQLQPRVSAVAA